MEWQQLVSLMIVGVTAILLVRHEVKKRRRAKLRACGQDCGCTSDVLETIKTQSQPKFSQTATKSLL